ncbi:putative RING-H2 finger protein ATL49 [Phragmites australis]|uniref:putative RING-H2 finger protein ATL49 n=1 Tax=Phragmites australis TaxID=29695 RepID=UPI002D798D00|nr:putative RING-H2 finger protein ATL49 [Phragmites australis]
MSHYTMHATINHAALSPTSPLQLPLPYLPPPPPPLFPPPAVAAASSDASFQSRISPSVLIIILILAVIFFVSGLLHLLVRFLLRPAPRDPGDAYGGDANATAFQGQLQQLFHLHDAGVDQAFIDALPVFLYGAVVGAGGKDPFDCAVCLCEFADDDRLRLLPKCSHAFHVDCIDTWLLSHSTCPLCRRSLLADFSPYGGGCSPLVFVLESGSEGSVSDRLDAVSSARLSFVMEQEEAGQDRKHAAEAAEKKDEVVVPVKLGKFRSQVPTEGSAAVSGGCSADPGQDVRRCYSMGTYEYVMDESSMLRISVKPPDKKRPATSVPGNRVAMSECDCNSKREGFRGFDAPPKQPPSKAAVDKRESFSISRIWMRGGPRRKDSAIAAPSCSTSRRASSFRFSSAPQRTTSDVGVAAAAGPNRRADVVSPVTESEYNVSAWDKSASVVDWDIESAVGGGHGISSRADEAPSFARRTLLWIRGHL